MTTEHIIVFLEIATQTAQEWRQLEWNKSILQKLLDKGLIKHKQAQATFQMTFKGEKFLKALKAVADAATV